MNKRLLGIALLWVCLNGTKALGQEDSGTPPGYAISNYFELALIGSPTPEEVEPFFYLIPNLQGNVPCLPWEGSFGESGENHWLQPEFPYLKTICDSTKRTWSPCGMAFSPYPLRSDQSRWP